MGPSDRLAAAQLASEVRTHRQQLVDAVASGALPLADLIGTGGSDHGAGGVKVVVLAQAVPGVGKVRSRRVLGALGIAEGARWAELSDAVASAVVMALAAAATACDA